MPEARPEDTTATKAELKEKATEIANDGDAERPAKKPKLEPETPQTEARSTGRKKGVAPIKQEFVHIQLLRLVH